MMDLAIIIANTCLDLYFFGNMEQNILFVLSIRSFVLGSYMVVKLCLITKCINKFFITPFMN
jgi:hypothetical protein